MYNGKQTQYIESGEAPALFDVGGDKGRYTKHQIMISSEAEISEGSFVVSAIDDSTDAFFMIPDGSVAAATGLPFLLVFEGWFDGLAVIPVGFDGDEYLVTLRSW